MIFGFLFINFPIRISLFTITAYLIFIFYQIFPLPDFNQYKIDYLLETLIDKNTDTFQILFFWMEEELKGYCFH